MAQVVEQIRLDIIKSANVIVMSLFIPMDRAFPIVEQRTFEINIAREVSTGYD